MHRLSIFLFAVFLPFCALAEAYKMANVVCFVKFSDQADSPWEHDRDYYEAMFNSTGEGVNSVRNYFSDMSYGRMDWESVIIADEYIDSHPRGYFCEKSASNPDGYTDIDLMLDTRTKTLVRDMCAYLSERIPDDVVLDADGDGVVDNIVVIFNGDSEWSASNMLWPANNTAPAARLKGLNVRNYLKVFDGANGYKSYVAQKLNTGVLCHEMMHTLDAYDLYTSKGAPQLEPVNIWDLMSDNQNMPQGLTAYMRMAYGEDFGGWLPKSDVPTLTEAGEYRLAPVSSIGEGSVAYKIVPDKKKAEYFMVEYRDRGDMWDSSLPASGILVYRVNPLMKGNLGNDYELYVFRPNGSLSSAGLIKRATLGPDTRRTSFGLADDNDYPFYSDGGRAYFSITDVREEDGQMVFSFYPNITGDSAVEGIEADKDGKETIFNLQGVRLDRIPGPGIYIVNGRKTIIR